VLNGTVCNYCEQTNCKEEARGVEVYVLAPVLLVVFAAEVYDIAGSLSQVVQCKHEHFVCFGKSCVLVA